MTKGSTQGENPSVNWFFNDWNGGTMIFTRHQKGCYMDLLTAQFNNGHLSLDAIKTVLGSDFGTTWPTLQKKFKTDNEGNYFNARLDFEISKKIKYNTGRKENLDPHMGNGSGKGNGFEIEKGNGNEKKAILFFENFRKIYRGTKAGSEVALKYFQKHKDWIDCSPLLLPALQAEIEYKESLISRGEFCPKWKDLKTWIHNRCWEQELPKLTEQQTYLDTLSQANHMVKNSYRDE